MESSSAIIFLVISCAASFALARLIVHLRGKKRDRLEREREAEAQRLRPAEKASQNKSKRKRQIQQELRKKDAPPR